MSARISVARGASTPTAPVVHRRVRHEARDALVVMAFSLGASIAVALFFRLLLAMGE
ncbi:MAG TPA: hypothetical protein VFO98_01370 [Marmoricola sp.]|jgi:hypothetical protein|nr:hypothetical protein [Marmoricola sp.]